MATTQNIGNSAWLHLTSGGYTGRQDRQLISASFGRRTWDAATSLTRQRSHGLLHSDAFQVTAQGSPNLTVNVSTGRALVTGTQATDQGVYVCYNDATKVLDIAAGHATLVRNDLIALTVKDGEFAAFPGGVTTVVQVVAGTAGAGDPALPADSLRLARVTVPALAATITNAMITNLAKHAGQTGGVLPVDSDADVANIVNKKNGDLFVTLDKGRLYVHRQGVTVPAIGAAAEVQRDTTNQVIPNTTLTAAQWNVAAHDPYVFWSAGNPSRLTAPWAGYYAASVAVRWASWSGGTFRMLFLTQNGSQSGLSGIKTPIAVVGGTMVQSCSIQGRQMAAGDYLEAKVYQDSGATRDLEFGTVIGEVTAKFFMAYLGPVGG